MTACFFASSAGLVKMDSSAATGPDSSWVPEEMGPPSTPSGVGFMSAPTSASVPPKLYAVDRGRAFFPGLRRWRVAVATGGGCCTGAAIAESPALPAHCGLQTFSPAEHPCSRTSASLLRRTRSSSSCGAAAATLLRRDIVPFLHSSLQLSPMAFCRRKTVAAPAPAKKALMQAWRSRPPPSSPPPMSASCRLCAAASAVLVGCPKSSRVSRAAPTAAAPPSSGKSSRRREASRAPTSLSPGASRRASQAASRASPRRPRARKAAATRKCALGQSGRSSLQRSASDSPSSARSSFRQQSERFERSAAASSVSHGGPSAAASAAAYSARAFWNSPFAKSSFPRFCSALACPFWLGIGEDVWKQP
mmetsp:Transcript_74911/g.219454  ORF Transcript_74911/g.219454 Transcript_74911/m.219454 type:complete len:363 (-) Transcript_74911:12-1100(-)